MYEEQYGGEISEEQVLFRQIIVIQGLSTRIFSDTSTGWQVNARNFSEAVKTFEATAIRHLDSEYKVKLKKIINRAKQQILNYRLENPANTLTDIGKEFEVAVSLDVSRKRLALLIKTLSNKGVFNETAYVAISSPKNDTIDKDKEELVSVR